MMVAEAEAMYGTTMAGEHVEEMVVIADMTEVNRVTAMIMILETRGVGPDLRVAHPTVMMIATETIDTGNGGILETVLMTEIIGRSEDG